jgi:hypothetical protein
MGGTLSAEEPPAEEALFDPEELRALRNCYAMLASPSNGALEITALLPWAALFRKGFPWAALFRKMTAASTPVRWQSFLGTIARCCKAQRSERLVTIASLYSGADDAPLDKAALKAMLSDALAAARGGGDEPAAVAATSSELDAVVADVLAGVAGGAVPIEAWIGWVTAQLPSLPTAVEGFLLHYLCAVGHASAAGAAIRSHSTAGAGGTRGSSAAQIATSAAQIATSAAQIATSAVHAEVPASVLAPLQEPLLSCAEGQSEGTELLTPPSAWLLSLAISRGAREEAADWRCVYASEVMGLSMNRFSHHADGYAGPTLLLGGRMQVLTTARPPLSPQVHTWTRRSRGRISTLAAPAASSSPSPPPSTCTGPPGSRRTSRSTTRRRKVSSPPRPTSQGVAVHRCLRCSALAARRRASGWCSRTT